MRHPRGNPNSPSNRKRNGYSCARKRAYWLQSQAEEEAKRIEQVTGIKAAAYVCGCCQLWHVGKDRRRSVNKRAAR